MFIINARIPHSSTILLNCHSRRHMVLARCRWSLANAECIPNNTHGCTIYDKDAAIEGGYHMEVKEEERKAHAWYMHGRGRGWELSVGWERMQTCSGQCRRAHTMSKAELLGIGGLFAGRRSYACISGHCRKGGN